MCGRMSKHKWGWVAWWIGIPIACWILAWLPFWIWNLSLGATRTFPWWRVPLVSSGVFDTYVYLHWLGAAVEGIQYGGHIKWMGSLLEPLWRVIKPVASLPELWLISRWLGLVTTTWVSAWAIEHYADLKRSTARIFALTFLCALVVTLSLRPGVYAWYLPFCLLGLIAADWVGKRLREQRVIQAIIWSVIALGASFIYPWFFLIVSTWVAVAWWMWSVRHRTWIAPLMIAVVSLLIGLASLHLAEWFLASAQSALIGMYERNGVVFARVPFFANTLIAIAAWIVLFFVLASKAPHEASRTALISAAVPWMAVLVLWFHTPITGIFLYPDHFIGPVAVLAWLSLSKVWYVVENTERFHASNATTFSRFLNILPWLIAIGAWLMLIYILQQPARLHPWKFDPYVVHVTHWFALAVASFLVVWRMRRFEITLPFVPVLSVMLFVGFAMGVWGNGSVLFRDWKKLETLTPRLSTIDWIRTSVPEKSFMCADPASASFYAAHTGRSVFPAEAVLSYPFSSPHVLSMLQTLVGAYDAKAAGQVETFHFLTDHYRIISCENGSQYAHNGTLGKLLRGLGLQGARLDTFLGCRRETIETNWQSVSRAMDAHTSDAQALTALCPYVIVPTTQATFWTLPPSSTLAWESDNIQIWKTH